MQPGSQGCWPADGACPTRQDEEGGLESILSGVGVALADTETGSGIVGTQSP